MDAVLQRAFASPARSRPSDFEERRQAKRRMVGLEGREALARSVVCTRRTDDRAARKISSVSTILSERVLAKMGHEREYGRCRWRRCETQFVLGAVRALGATQARWIADYFRIGRRYQRCRSRCCMWIAASCCASQSQDGMHLHTCMPGTADICLAAARGGLRATHTTLLSPFDPVVWDRERASALFEFDYRLECYTPAPKRIYGYYVLADPASRPAGRTARREGASCGRKVRGQGAVSGGRRRPGRCVCRCDRARAARNARSGMARRIVSISRCAPRAFKRPLQQALRLTESGRSATATSRVGAALAEAGAAAQDRVLA